MAEKKLVNEREYVIPLRKAWMQKPRYKKTRAGVMGVKKFVAKHMRVPERDLNKVKLDVYLNNEMWFRGCKNPPSKIKVIVKRDGDVIRVEMAEMPVKWKFAKARHAKKHKKAGKKAKVEEKPVEVKTEEEKKEESEKAKSAADVKEKQAEQQAKAQKQIDKSMKAPKFQQRKSLKK